MPARARQINSEGFSLFISAIAAPLAHVSVKARCATSFRNEWGKGFIVSDALGANDLGITFNLSHVCNRSNEIFRI